MLDLLPKTVPVGGFTDESLGKHPRNINIITDGEFNVHRLVSQRLKDVIEGLEPGVHQFAPVSFVNYVTREPIWTDLPWYIFNITTWIAPDRLFDWQAMGDALDFRINRPYEHFSGDTVMSFPSWSQYKKYVVRRSAILFDIGARHLWVTNFYFKAIDRRLNIQPAAFCSETFRRACKAAGLKGGHFIQLATERPDEEARYVGPWSDALRKAERAKRTMRWDLRLGERVEATTMEEALSLARALLDDPVQGALLRRVGVHGDWDWEIEHQRLLDFITRYAKAAGWGQRDPDTLHAIVAFARRIAAGQFAPDSPQARDWLAFNIHNGTHYRIHEGLAQAHVQEIFHLARAVQSDPAIVDLLREMLEPKVFRIDEVWAEYRIFEKKYAIKYGLCHRNRLTEAIRLVHKVMKGELPSVDGDEAYEHLKTYCGNPDLPRARYDGICNV